MPSKARPPRTAPKQRANKSKEAKPAVASTRRAPANKRKPATSSEDEQLESTGDDEDPSDAYQVSGEESTDEDAPSLDSDALDEEEVENAKRHGKRKRARSPSKGDTSSPRKRRKTEEEEDEWDEEDGQEIVGRVVEAPKTGRVPPGRISQNTLNFLTDLKKPECNDREWFKLHEPIFRVAEQEFKDFVSKFTDDLIEVDTQIPPLPAKDVLYRIYRDVRFSNDKTPYKTGFSASFSRSGRKGIFAGYHIIIKPDGESKLAAGSWSPGKNELDTIRSHIQRNPRRLRTLLAQPEFVELFGEPKPGSRTSIYGRDDELKNAPKGVDKKHKDIDLLKCRTFAVVHNFSDEEVLSSDFRDKLIRVVRVALPLVHCLNDWMTVGLDEDGADEDSDDDEEEAGSDDNDD